MVHTDFETFVNEMPPSIVCVAPCHPPVAWRSDAEHAARWDDAIEVVASTGPTLDAGGLRDVEAVVFVGSLADEEQEPKINPPTMHNHAMERRATP